MNISNQELEQKILLAVSNKQINDSELAQINSYFSQRDLSDVFSRCIIRAIAKGMLNPSDLASLEPLAERLQIRSNWQESAIKELDLWLLTKH